MKRVSLFSLLLALVAATQVWSQTAAWQFRWQKGQVLHYKIEHKTQVTELAEGSKVESASQLNLVKRWEVLSVDEQGVATVQMSLTAMRNQQTRPNGEVLLFDSANLDKSTPELREQMSKFIGKPLATIRIDAQGRVHDDKQGTSARYEAEPAFHLVLPASAPQPGQAMLRPYTISMDPPLGTGEKHQAVQKYTVSKIESGKATLALTTEIKTPPASAGEQVPLVQKQPQGQLIFDVQAGRLHAAQLQIDRTVENHQGQGSSYRFVSSYSEQLAE